MANKKNHKEIKDSVTWSQFINGNDQAFSSIYAEYSGSHLLYPSVFRKSTRDVFLSVDAYFYVAAHKEIPFIVMAGEMKVRVTGTKFNVSSWENDQATQIVLVEGRISSAMNKPFSKQTDLIPGERVVFEKTTHSMMKDKVDTELYSTWINEYLIFRNEPAPWIFRKLDRYHDHQIIADGNTDNITFSGKLDLKEDIDLVFNNISNTASFYIFSYKEYIHQKK